MHGVLGANGDVMVVNHALDLGGFYYWIKSRHSVGDLDDLGIDSFPWRGCVRRHEHVIDVLEVFSEALRAVND